ncbi:MAG: hypothetical protein RMX63_34195 [Aulosira sp. ZfuCHP01]|nr:hypothetical protein [Aulosira sp. DedVER01a]MDZ8056477.1 hypothetical protein [Aulosira sp. ZfuCHP01]
MTINSSHRYHSEEIITVLKSQLLWEFQYQLNYTQTKTSLITHVRSLSD